MFKYNFNNILKTTEARGLQRVAPEPYAALQPLCISSPFDDVFNLICQCIKFTLNKTKNIHDS